MSRTSAVVAMVAGVLALNPAAGAAKQAAVAWFEATAGKDDPAVFEAQARALFSTPERYGEAATLMLKAAAARSVGDPVRIDDLVLAARLSFYDGRERKAHQVMVRAAREAQETGDVITAAHAYIDAAFLGGEAREPADAISPLIEKAKLLSYSPLLTEAQRGGILARLSGV